ncbi:hypothetical protein BRC86_03060 [Halobacteriales archaeon QS_3_64_16]|nr:MAG: hypothetical protein BRC86_03060 [Halobacteriales archaeon QS_3_64_16]
MVSDDDKSSVGGLDTDQRSTPSRCERPRTVTPVGDRSNGRLTDDGRHDRRVLGELRWTSTCLDVSRHVSVGVPWRDRSEYVRLSGSPTLRYLFDRARTTRSYATVRARSATGD